MASSSGISVPKLKKVHEEFLASILNGVITPLVHEAPPPPPTATTPRSGHKVITPRPGAAPSPAGLITMRMNPTGPSLTASSGGSESLALRAPSFSGIEKNLVRSSESSASAGSSKDERSTSLNGVSGTNRRQNSGSSNVSVIPDGVTPFEFLYSERGFNNIKNWFANSASASRSFNETQFITFLRDLTDYADHEILEIFDTLDKNDQGQIGFAEFFLIISILVARETGQLTYFLYLNGATIFEILTDLENLKEISFERFSRVGLLLGIKEEDLINLCGMKDLDLSKSITYEDFMIYVFTMFEVLDSEKKHSTEGNTSPLNTNSSRQSDKDKCIIS